MKKIQKNALIGAGVIGKVHSRCLSDMGKPFTAICDIDKDKAVAMAGDWAPDALIYTDYKQMIDELEPDVIHVCTPHYLHAEMIIYALSKGVNVLCEKPICISLDQVEQIRRARESSKAQLGVCFQNRYLGSNIFAKEFLKDKEIDSAHGSVIWHRDADYYRADPWRGSFALEGGGVMINQAIHTLDLIAWLCGMPEYVLAKTDNLSLRGVIEVEDTASAFFEGENNFSFYATNAASSNMPVSIDIRLSNKDLLSILPNSVSLNGELIYSQKKQSFAGKSYYGGGHGLLIPDFYRHVEEGIPFPIDDKEAAKVLSLVLAIYESRGERIKIKYPEGGEKV